MKIVPDKYGFYTVYADDGCVLVNEKTKIITTQFCSTNTDGWKEIKESDAPDYSDDSEKSEITANEIWKIIESSNISKENKSKIREFIERVI